MNYCTSFVEQGVVAASALHALLSMHSFRPQQLMSMMERENEKKISAILKELDTIIVNESFPMLENSCIDTYSGRTLNSLVRTTTFIFGKSAEKSGKSADPNAASMQNLK